jgi:hypothetical protein
MFSVRSEAALRCTMTRQKNTDGIRVLTMNLAAADFVGIAKFSQNGN